MQCFPFDYQKIEIFFKMLFLYSKIYESNFRIKYFKLLRTTLFIDSIYVQVTE